MTLEVVPCTIGGAKEYVRQHHRHHQPPLSGLFAVAVALEGEVVGVAIVVGPWRAASRTAGRPR